MLVFFLFSFCFAYKPVFFLHGINGYARDGNSIKSWLPSGQIFVAVPLFEGAPKSWTNLPTQVHFITSWIEHYVKSNSGFKNGYHLVCHSQGALICRCIAEYWDNHKIDTLVSLAGPQLGVYGDSYLKFINIPALEFLTADIAWRVLYQNATQMAFSVAQLWHDSKHQQSYEENNTLLPEFNGEKGEIPKYKANFLRLRKAAFYTGDMGSQTSDDGIDPWFSGAFSYYDKRMKRVGTKDSYVYTHDTFGLKTMDQRGDLIIETPKWVHHGDWIHNYNIYAQYIKPLITQSDFDVGSNVTESHSTSK